MSTSSQQKVRRISTTVYGLAGLLLLLLLASMQASARMNFGGGAAAGAAEVAVEPLEPLTDPGSDPATSVSFLVYETSCNNGTRVDFSVNGNVVASLDPRGDCTCNPSAPKTVTVTDPAVLALFATPVCT